MDVGLYPTCPCMHVCMYVCMYVCIHAMRMYARSIGELSIYLYPREYLSTI